VPRSSVNTVPRSELGNLVISLDCWNKKKIFNLLKLYRTREPCQPPILWVLEANTYVFCRGWGPIPLYVFSRVSLVVAVLTILHFISYSYAMQHSEKKCVNGGDAACNVISHTQ